MDTKQEVTFIRTVNALSATSTTSPTPSSLSLKPLPPNPVIPITSLIQIFNEKRKTFQEAEKQLDDAKHNLFHAFVEDEVKKRNLQKHIEAFKLPKNVVVKMTKDNKRKFFLDEPALICSACENKAESKVNRAWFSKNNKELTFNLRHGDLIVSKDQAETLILSKPLCLMCSALFCDRVSSLVEKSMKAIYIENATGFGKTVEGDDLVDTEVIYKYMMSKIIQ